LSDIVISGGTPVDRTALTGRTRGRAGPVPGE
jgi:hypothetical protein